MNNTDFLIAKPNFLSGLARVMDMGANLPSYNLSDNPVEADQKAIKNDWEMAAQDLRKAIAALENERRKSK